MGAGQQGTQRGERQAECSGRLCKEIPRVGLHPRHAVQFEQLRRLWGKFWKMQWNGNQVAPNVFREKTRQMAKYWGIAVVMSLCKMK